MSGSLNKVMLIGNLGKDPESKMTANGQPFVRFSLATTETWRSQAGEKKQKTEWHNIVVWGKLAEIAEKYLRKGKKIMVEGRIQYQEWTAPDGNKKLHTSINCDNFIMLSRMDEGPRQSGGSYDSHPPAAEPEYGDQMQPQSQGGYDDDIPF